MSECAIDICYYAVIHPGGCKLRWRITVTVDLQVMLKILKNMYSLITNGWIAIHLVMKLNHRDLHF